MEVPLMVRSDVSESYHADVMDEPGANTSTHVPKFEKDDRESLDAVAPTVIAEDSLAGDRTHASVFSLPAATAKTMPSATPRATAAFMVHDAGPPRLMFATAGTPAW